MAQKFLEEKHLLEEQIAEEDALSQHSFFSGRSKAQEWLAKHRTSGRLSVSVEESSEEEEEVEGAELVGAAVSKTRAAIEE